MQMYHGITVFTVRWVLCRFYGFSCAQTQYYFHEYPKDKTHLKTLVRPARLYLSY